MSNWVLSNSKFKNVWIFCLGGQNESELFGRTIRVNLAKPMKVKEGASRAGEFSQAVVEMWCMLCYLGTGTTTNDDDDGNGGDDSNDDDDDDGDFNTNTYDDDDDDNNSDDCNNCDNDGGDYSLKDDNNNNDIDNGFGDYTPNRSNYDNDVDNNKHLAFTIFF